MGIILQDDKNAPWQEISQKHRKGTSVSQDKHYKEGNA